MEVSDDEETPKKKQKVDYSNDKNRYHDENDSLKCQMEAYKNEV